MLRALMLGQLCRADSHGVGVVVALTFSSVSWYASLIPAGVTYYFLMKNTGDPAKRFSQ